MAKAGYEPVMRSETTDKERQEAAVPHQWHGSLLNCCGCGLGTSTLGASTAFLTHFLPCVTFGKSAGRAFGKHVVRNTLLVLALVLLSWAHYGTQTALVVNECLADLGPPHHHGARHGLPRHMGAGYTLDADGTLRALDAHPPKFNTTSVRGRCAKPFGHPLAATSAAESPLCNHLTNAGIVLNAVTILWSLLVVCYGAAQRTSMRERFNIEGSRLGDFCTWFWCMQCAMCQESRTLEVNNVEAGMWLGRAGPGLPIINAADAAQAPSVAVMTAAAAPSGLSASEQQCAATKL